MSDTYDPGVPEENPDQYATQEQAEQEKIEQEKAEKAAQEQDQGADQYPDQSPERPPEQPPTQGSPQQAPEDREKVWQDYASKAIYALYPNMREGVDYAWGKRKAEDTPEMLEWSERFTAPDMGKIEEIATRLMEQDPYATGEYRQTEGVSNVSTRQP